MDFLVMQTVAADRDGDAPFLDSPYLAFDTLASLAPIEATALTAAEGEALAVLPARVRFGALMLLELSTKATEHPERVHPAVFPIIWRTVPKYVGSDKRINLLRLLLKRYGAPFEYFFPALEVTTDMSSLVGHLNSIE